MDATDFYMFRSYQSGQEDLTFRFRFQTTVSPITLSMGEPGMEVDVAIPPINVGPSSEGNLDVIEEDRLNGLVTSVTNSATSEATFFKPADSIGEKSIADYAVYAGAHILRIALPGGVRGDVA